MAMIEYQVRFADDTRMPVMTMSAKGKLRLGEMRLDMSPDKCGLRPGAALGTPSGVQILFSHDGDRASVGRVTDMYLLGNELLGTVVLNEDMVKEYIAGGHEALDSGVNSGLSIGFKLLDNPPLKVKMGKGTREDPDQVVFGAIGIYEASLTPVPKIPTAGLLGPGKRIGEMEDSMSETREIENAE